MLKLQGKGFLATDFFEFLEGWFVGHLWSSSTQGILGMKHHLLKVLDLLKMSFKNLKTSIDNI